MIELIGSERALILANVLAWQGQKGHLGFTPRQKDLLKQELQMPCRALSINALATAKYHAAGYPMSRANWARQLQSALPNWKLYVSSLGKTLRTSYVTKRNGGLFGAAKASGFSQTGTMIASLKR